MSVGSWTPENNDPVDNYQPSEHTLRLFIELSRQNKLEILQAQMPKEQIEKEYKVMKLAMADWQSLVSPFDNDDLYQLIQFFTRAEMLLPGWEAGAESPVVWLTKILRQRKSPLEKEQLQWIKSHSTNRFIPNGALI